ncbi:hypothetical protein EMCG_02871 [[Emmonsia] crescens]|uniref:Uncharacterized protein n=1 Tax=[Emmonsia] crescens TaxID=73230 RepID=A0A0G2J8S9_9EURO|nr:hypothetical protein EMCG_02871 [Emmonsia crescens UAMH 3008]
MDDRIVDLYLSTKLMDDPDGAKEKKTRLRQFVHHDKEIRNAKRISENSEQGVVFRIEIEGREYCLKVFKRWKFLSLLKIRERTQMLHSPFAYECRAFARLIDVGQNGTWAVKCHGWMRLSEDQFDALKPVVTRQQIATCDRWAIVKDYIHNPFHVDDIPEICKKLPIPKYALIAPMDFHPHNFRESFFVDLGSTRTYPCPPL